MKRDLSSARRLARRTGRPVVEAMEGRLLLAQVFTVTNAGDSGGGTLRQAIIDANADQISDTIEFNIPASGVQTIAPLSALPAISAPVLINGYTQFDASENTLASGSNAVVRIGLDGSGAGQFPNGLTIAAPDVTIRGLAVGGFGGSGFAVLSTNAAIEGNFIGTDATGTAARPNGTGVFVSSSGGRIGGAAVAARNLISGNTSSGIDLFGTDARSNRVVGNLIGLDANGSVALGNAGDGVRLFDGASSNTIGGSAAGEGNRIASNGGAGINIQANSPGVVPATSANVFAQNSIYANVAGPIVQAADQQAPPTLRQINTESGTTTVNGAIVGAASTVYTIEFFSAATGDGNSELTYVGSTTVTTDAIGEGQFSPSFTPGMAQGRSVYATATGGGRNTSEFSDSIVEIPDAQTADVVVFVTPSTGTPTVGVAYSYTIDVRNNGPADVVGTSLVFDGPAEATFVSATGGATPDSSGLITYNLGAIANQGSIQLVITYIPNSPGTIATQANLSSSPTDSDTSNNSVLTTVTVMPAPLPAVDLSTSIIASATTVDAGTLVTYTLRVANLGPDTVPGVTLTDVLPAGAEFVSASTGTSPVNGILTFNIGTFGPGAIASVTFVVRLTAPGPATNTATATPVNANETNFGNNNAALIVTVNPAPTPNPPPPVPPPVPPPGPSGTADLVLTQVVSAPSVVRGGVLTFTLTVFNAGPEIASGVVLTDALPAASLLAGITVSQGTFGVAGGVLTAQLGDLVAGASATVVINVNPAALGTATSSAGVATSTRDANLDNNNALASVAVVVAPVTPVNAPPLLLVDARRTGQRRRFQFALAFNRALNPASAQNPSNYTLTAAGRDRRFGTRDDVRVRIGSASYNAATNSVTLTPRGRFQANLAYQLRVVGSGLTDAAGRPLDGNRDGTPGGDALANLRGATPGSLL